MEKKSKKDSYPSKYSLFVRILAGGYLLYLAYGLRDAPRNYSGIQGILFILVMIGFSVLGIFLCVVSLRSFAKGEYDDGSGSVEPPAEDAQASEETEENDR